MTPSTRTRAPPSIQPQTQHRPGRARPGRHDHYSAKEGHTVDIRTSPLRRLLADTAAAERVSTAFENPVGRWIHPRGGTYCRQNATVGALGGVCGHMEPLHLSELLRGFEGKWVAIKGGQVVAAAETPDALFKRLRSTRIHNASVLRAPTEQERRAELVGLG